MKLTARGGRCLLYGLPADDAEIRFPVKEIIMNQVTVYGVTNNELAWDPMIEMVAAGKINVKDMVTHHYKLSQLEEAVKTVMERPDSLIKAVVHPWEE